jgi:tetratricopeptide (TPR) repeat protein
MLRFAGAAALVWVLGALGASAQTTPNPVMQHYRAYQAAMQAGDLATAETEAVAALAASEARSGDGGNTAALALNLANVQLERGRAREALPAAQRAFGLAQAGGAVDPLAASLTLGRAELVTSRAEGERRLFQAIAEVERRGEFKDEAFEAAMAMGRLQLDDDDADDAVRSFGAAVRLAAGDDDDHRISRATAHIAHGMALMVDDDPGRASPNVGEVLIDRPTGGAQAAFSASFETSLPLALRDGPNGAFTSAQSVYAQALAWEAAYRAKLRSMGWRLSPTDARSLLLDGDTNDGLPPCPFGVRTEPGPIFPAQLRSGQYGSSAVAVRVRTNAAGEIVEAATVALAGRQEVAEEVDRVAPRWQAVNWDETTRCSRAGVLLFTYAFWLEPTF